MVPSVLTIAAYRSSRCAAAVIGIRIDCHGKSNFLFRRIFLDAAPEAGWHPESLPIFFVGSSAHWQTRNLAAARPDFDNALAK